VRKGEYSKKRILKNCDKKKPQNERKAALFDAFFLKISMENYTFNFSKKGSLR
jgi:hypothetical protein